LIGLKPPQLKTNAVFSEILCSCLFHLEAMEASGPEWALPKDFIFMINLQAKRPKTLKVT
jgi:hypothetical protein